MEYQEIIEKRYSVRKFDRKAEVSEDQIKAILEAGRLAPTAKNVQSQRIYVVSDPVNLKKIDGATQCRNGAPYVLVVGFDNDENISHKEFSPYDRWGFGEQDAVSVLMHMMLKATDLGLGTLWVGSFDTRVVKRELDLPLNFMVRALLMVGVPAEDCEPSEQHAERKPLEETVIWVQAPEAPAEPAAAPAAEGGDPVDERAAARAARKAAREARKAAAAAAE